MPNKRRFTVIEHWTCTECSGDGHVYEDRREQARYSAQRITWRYPILARSEGATALMVAGEEFTSSSFRSDRVVCPACKGKGQGQREVSLEEALKELGVFTGVGAIKRPDV